MQTASERITLSVSPPRLQVLPGGWAQSTVTVTSHASVVDQFDVTVEGIDPSMVTISDPRLNLFPGASGTLLVQLYLPESPPMAAGSRPITVLVGSREDPTSRSHAEIELEVLPVGRVELELVPRRLAARDWARTSLLVTNGSNAHRALDLFVSDPEAMLEVRPPSERLAIAAGERAEVRFELRPRRRPRFGATRHHAFTITAFPAGAEAAEPIGTADGELVYRPGLAFLAGLPRRLRLLALVLAALLLAAVLAVWFLGAPLKRAAARAASGTAGALSALATDLNPEVAGVTSKPAPDPVIVLPPPVPTPAPPRPRITRFELALPSGPAAGAVDLQWQVEDAQQVRLLQVRGGQPTPLDAQPFPAEGTWRVQLTGDVDEFLLEATSGVETVVKSIGLLVLQPPEIRRLTAEPAAITRGQSVAVSWEAARATRASLDGQDVDPAAGTVQLQPERSASLTLVVQNEFGRTERSISIPVSDPPPAR